MPVELKGSCRCGAIRFSCQSHTPVPYQRCYCSICRKTAGGGGYAINIMGVADTLAVDDPEGVKAVYRAGIEDADGTCRTSAGERNFCTRCAAALWLWDPSWPELVHPFASAIDTELPEAPASVHLLLAFKPAWVVPQIGTDDSQFDGYPEQSIEDWHRSRGLWID